MEETYLEHHGILGQKWGVRRYQNSDGTLTAAGKKRYGSGEAQSSQPSGVSKDTLKKVAAGALLVGGVAAAGYYASKNPTVVSTALKTIGQVSIRSLETAGNKAVVAGKKYMKAAAQSALEGAKEGFANAPRQVAKVAVEGATILALRKMANMVIGENNMNATTDGYNAYKKKDNRVKNPNLKSDISNAAKKSFRSKKDDEDDDD